MSEPGRDLVGRKVGAFRVLEILGEGGMGRVYRGHDERLGREVAIKEIRPERRPDEHARVRFRREARILSRLEHPNICRVYELLETTECDYLVLELVRGTTLCGLLRGSVERGRALEIAVQIAAALEAAHAMSVVHRDLKPENIMIDADGAVRVLDFGLALSNEDPDGCTGLPFERDEGAAERAVATLTRTRHLMGTPRYMSPEQARCEAVTAASDLYSFGLVLQELWSGQPPYEPGTSIPTLLRRAMWGDVDRVPDLPTALASLVDGLLELDPNARPTAAVAIQRLQRILEAPRRRVVRFAAAAAVASLLVAVVALGIGYFRMRDALAVEAAAHQRSEAMGDFLISVLASGDPAVRGPETRVKDVLASGAAKIDEKLAEHPRSWASAHQAIAASYVGLGLYDQAVEHFSLACEKLRPIGDEVDEEAVACTQELGSAMLLAGRLEEAESLVRQSQADAQEKLTPDTVSRWVVQSQLGMVLSRRAKHKEAEHLLREACSQLERLVGPADSHTMRAYASLLGVVVRSGRVDEAAAMGREHLARCERVLGARHPDTLRLASNLAATLRHLDGHQQEAIGILQRVVTDASGVLGEDHPTTLLALFNLGVLYKNTARLDEAEETLRRVVDLRRRALGDDHPDVAAALSSLAPVLGRTGRFDEGEAMLSEAITISEAADGPTHPYTLNVMANLGNLLEARGDLRRAAETFAEVRRRSEAGAGPVNGFSVQMSCAQARVLAAAGDRRSAIALLEGDLARLEDAAPGDPRVQRLTRARTSLGSTAP